MKPRLENHSQVGVCVFRRKIGIELHPLVPSLRGLAKIPDFCLGECPAFRSTLPPPLRGISLREGGKGREN